MVRSCDGRRGSDGGTCSEQALADEVRSFDFFQALRLIERVHAQKPRLGKARRGADDPIRLAQRPQLAFPPTDLAAYEPGSGGRPGRPEVLLMGLFGPQGPLPLHLTAYALSARDRATIDLRRLLRHLPPPAAGAVLSGLGRARPARAARPPGEDRFRLYLGALAGLGTPALRTRDALPDAVQGRARRHCSAARAGTPSAWTGCCAHLPCRCRSRSSSAAGSSCRGACAPARPGACPARRRGGRRHAAPSSAQHRFRLRLGPLDLATYRALPARWRLAAPADAAVRTRSATSSSGTCASGCGPRGAAAGSTGRAAGLDELARRPAPARDADDLVLCPAGRGLSG